MKIKTENLIGPALDWAVFTALYGRAPNPSRCVAFSTNWAQGGPIIEREKIDIDFYKADCEASKRGDAFCALSGPTPLIAAMRCYVSSRLGDTVEVPDELT